MPPASISPATAQPAGGGPFAKATTDLAFLLEVAQGAEDTGVRAYKGQAGNLMSNPAILEGALRIHSVEARHASRIRRMRRAAAGAPTTVRYSGTVRGGDAAAAGATDLGTNARRSPLRSPRSTAPARARRRHPRSQTRYTRVST